MLYVVPVTVPPNTPKAAPVEHEVTVDEDVLVLVSVRFPPGPCGLTYVSLWYGVHQIFPSWRYDWVHDDNTVVWDLVMFKCPTKPCTFRIKAYNLDTQYEHTVIVYLLALDENYVALIGRQKLILRLVRSMWTSMLEKLGLRRLGWFQRV